MHVFDIYNNEIAYYKTPKCGSRTILGWAALLKEPNLITEHPEWFQESRQKIEYTEIRSNLTAYTESLTHNQKIRFCIVRDPVERFISAFTNRILFHKKPEINVSIDEFIDNFDNILSQENFKKGNFYKNLAIHFTTQVYYIGAKPELYTHIFNIKELYKVKDLLETHTGIKLPNLHLQKSGNIKKPLLNDKQTEWIKNKYKIDYEIYEKWF